MKSPLISRSSTIARGVLGTSGQRSTSPLMNDPSVHLSNVLQSWVGPLYLMAWSRRFPEYALWVFISCSAFVTEYFHKKVPYVSFLFEGFDISLNPDHFSIFRIHDCCKMRFLIQNRIKIHPSNDAIFSKALFVPTGFL